MPLLSVTFPEATKFLYSIIVEISSFDLLPLDKIKENSFFSFDDQENVKLEDKNFNALDIF